MNEYLLNAQSTVGFGTGNGALGNLSADSRTITVTWRSRARICDWEENAKIKAGMQPGDQVQDSVLRNKNVETRRVLGQGACIKKIGQGRILDDLHLSPRSLDQTSQISLAKSQDLFQMLESHPYRVCSAKEKKSMKSPENWGQF